MHVFGSWEARVPGQNPHIPTRNRHTERIQQWIEPGTLLLWGNSADATFDPLWNNVYKNDIGGIPEILLILENKIPIDKDRGCFFFEKVSTVPWILTLSSHFAQRF